jgi:hypothetical protein
MLMPTFVRFMVRKYFMVMIVVSSISKMDARQERA